MQEESNEERKEKGESLSGGESSAEYIISKSEKGTQVPDSTKRISPTTDTKNPTIESRNVEIKERGESLPGGESSAEYITSQAGVGEGEEELRRKDETEKDTESMGDKIKAGAKALKKKAGDPDRDLSTEYEKEKVK
jgi:hypothetical protein